MANWYGMTRSNYVRVKDPEQFRKYVGVFDAYVIDRVDADGVGRFGFVTEDDCGDVPSRSTWDDDDDEEIVAELKDALGPDYHDLIDETYSGEEDQVSVLEYIGHTLADGEVMTVFSAGNEKARYVTGNAWVITSDGEIKHISLDDAVEAAIREMGHDPRKVTDAAY